MEIVSVNIGKAVPFDNPVGSTGIFKTPQNGPVTVGPYGCEGDDVCDLDNHGGLDQAVYMYGLPDYAFWARELAREMTPGLFGENLTISGLASQDILVGDRFEIGELVLEATAPRIPCVTFGVRMGEGGWVKRFHAANRPGVYGRVLQAGVVEAGMPVHHIRYAGEPIPLIELMYDYKAPSAERMRRLMQAPIHRDLVARYTARLAAGA
jgi:MOSC domain-containing protein YiiM